LRGESNINLLAEGNGHVMSTPQMQQFQERSIVHPFVHGEQNLISSQVPLPVHHQQVAFQEPHYVREPMAKHAVDFRPQSPR